MTPATILEQLCNDLSAYTAAVMLPDYSRKVLKTVYSYNLHPTWAALTNPFDHSTNNGKAFTTGESVLKNHAHEKTLRTAEYQHPIESIAVVPIKLSNQIVGTLVVLGDDENIEFDNDSLRLIYEAAEDIAAIIS